MPGGWRALAEWAREGPVEGFVVVNNHYEGHAPATVRALARELREQGLDVVPLAGRPAGQQTMF